MGRRGHFHKGSAIAVGAAILGLVSIASAQVADGGKTLRLTFGQSLVYSDNIELVAEPQESTLRSSTRLGLEYRDVTETQRLEFATNASIEFDSGDDGNSGSEVSDPFARFLYTREGANSRFSFAARYLETDLDDVSLTLGELFPDIELSDEIVDNIAVIETGIRTDRFYDLEVETGIQSALGFRLNLSSRERRYDELQLFNLSDNTFIEGEAELILRIDPAMTARLVASGSDLDAVNEDQTDRRQFFFGVGLAYDVTPGTQLDLFVGHEDIERDGVTGLLEASGVRLTADLTRDMPNGDIGIRFASIPTLNGRQSTLRLLRSQTLRRGGQLSYGIGVNQNTNLGTEPLFSLAYVQPLRRGRFDISLDQEPRTAESTSEQVVTTRVSMGYALALTPRVNFSVRAGLDRFDVLSNDDFRNGVSLRSDLVGQINPVSSWSVGATVSDIEGRTEGIETSNEQRYGIELAYRRALTRDWNMVASYRHSSILSNIEDDRESNTITLGIERSFDTRF